MRTRLEAVLEHNPLLHTVYYAHLRRAPMLEALDTAIQLHLGIYREDWDTTHDSTKIATGFFREAITQDWTQNQLNRAIIEWLMEVHGLELLIPLPSRPQSGTLHDKSTDP